MSYVSRISLSGYLANFMLHDDRSNKDEVVFPIMRRSSLYSNPKQKNLSSQVSMSAKEHYLSRSRYVAGQTTRNATYPKDARHDSYIVAAQSFGESSAF